MIYGIKKITSESYYIAYQLIDDEERPKVYTVLFHNFEQLIGIVSKVLLNNPDTDLAPLRGYTDIDLGQIREYIKLRNS